MRTLRTYFRNNLHLWYVLVCLLSLFSCVRLCDPMDFSQPDFSVHGILQARILEWVVISSRGSSQPRDQTQVSLTADGFFTV